MRRILSLFLTLVMALSIFTSVPLTVSAASVDDLIFALNEDGVSYSVTGCDEEASGTLVIPGTYKGKPVTNISGLSWCSGLISVVIPDSVTSIGYYAFYKCTNLKSITIPDGVTSIGGFAFKDCTHLTSVTIPDSVKSIGERVFNNTGYYNNENNWENGVLYINNHLIAANKFDEDNYEYIGNVEGAHVIKQGTKTIAASAFQDCKNLTSITIPNSVTCIADYAFYNCDSLTSITIPDTVTSMGEDVFYNTGYYNNESNWENGVLYINNHLIAANKYDEDDCEYTGNVEGAYTIKQGTKTIAKYAFYECDGLISVTIGNDLTSIGDYAFCDCTSLLSITIPNSVTSIGDRAFYNCASLTSINVSDNLTSIGIQTFYNCTSLASITIPDSVTSIGNSAFQGCSSLAYVRLSDSITNIPGFVFYDCTSLSRIAIPDSVTNIGNSAFYRCSSLESLSIPNSVTSIDGFAFQNCTSLTTITIPNSVTSIGDYVFSGCKNLTSVKIPCTVTRICEGAFFDCTSLVSVDIPDVVTSIGKTAFYNCTSLESITIPNSVTRIGEGAFWNCRAIKSIVIPNGVTRIENNAFNGCYWLTSVAIPDTVTNIGESAFWYCANLPSVAIPKNVTIIGENAFCGCSSLKYSFYKGTKNQWAKVDIGTGNSCLIDAKMHFESINHTESSWITDSKATINAEGSKHKECTECGEILETETIKQLKCSKPKLKTIANTATGVKITWGKVSGADSYEVYRKVKGGSYSKVGTTSKTYFTDKKAKSGKQYYYVVKAVNEAGKSSNSSYKTIKYLADPTLKTPTSAKAGITLKWNKITGAQGYVVYRKTGNGSFTKIATVKGVSKISCVDKSTKKGKKYTYKVKAYYGKTYSAYSNAKSITDKY